MSDYLWDKTGEADPDVERLETLLGGFAHRPRPLKLPAVEGRGRRGHGLRYAAAAAVLLAVFAGALVALRLARPGDAGTVAEAPVRTADPQASASPVAPPRRPDGVGVSPDEPAPRGPQAHESAKKSKRTRRHAASGSAAGGSRAGGAAVAPEVAGEGQRLRAKEQLLYALRLTGVKLEEVRRKVQGADEAEVVPVGRSRTR